VVLETEAKAAVGFSLGIVELLPRASESGAVDHLGPDLLGHDWNEATAINRLSADPARTITEALLDQTNLAGVGNMYAAELCFTSGIHPAAPVGEVRDLARLVRRAKLMLEHNKERPTQSTTGDLREPFWVYRRERNACRRCGTPIQSGMLGPPGRERATYWCPSCQHGHPG
jgi:endonuclease-8